MAVGDINNDVVVGVMYGNSGGVAPHLNTTASGATAPTFNTAQEFLTGAAYYPSGLALADFNGDGKPDIVTVNSDNNKVSVLLNTTAAHGGTRATFSAQYSFAVAPTPAPSPWATSTATACPTSSSPTRTAAR